MTNTQLREFLGLVKEFLIDWERMDAKKRNPFSGDTLNSLVKDGLQFHRSKAYWHYKRLIVEETPSTGIWYSGIGKFGCMPQVFNFSDLILWCSKMFDSTNRVIQVGEGGKTPIYLTPHIFQKMSRLPTTNHDLKLAEEDSFISNNGGGEKVLKEFLRSPTKGEAIPTQIDIDLLANPYKEFTWLFTYLVGQESNTFVLK